MNEMYYVGYHFGSGTDRKTGERFDFCALFAVSQFDTSMEGYYHGGMKMQKLKCVNRDVLQQSCAALCPGDLIEVRFNQYGQVCQILKK